MLYNGTQLRFLNCSSPPCRTIKPQARANVSVAHRASVTTNSLRSEGRRAPYALMAALYEKKEALIKGIEKSSGSQGGLGLRGGPSTRAVKEESRMSAATEAGWDASRLRLTARIAGSHSRASTGVTMTTACEKRVEKHILKK